VLREHAGWGEEGSTSHLCEQHEAEEVHFRAKKQTGFNQIPYLRASALFSHHKESVYAPLKSFFYKKENVGFDGIICNT